MAIQSPFFNKRDAEAAPARSPGYANPSSTYAPPSASGSNPAGHTSAGATSQVGNPASTSATQPRPESASKLTVGPNIKLKGVEITDCDTLVVEGTVEATMDSRLMQISEQGAFKGSAQIDIAEIHGAFDGNLTVRQRLVIHSTGRVTGKIRYGKVIIEEGGQLSGEIQFGAPSAATSVATPKSASNRPELQIIG